MTDNQYKYIGGELELFARAHNWKTYIRQTIAPFIFGDVLEVGAGIGETTRLLSQVAHKSWLCVEPDEYLLEGLARMLSSLSGHKTIEWQHGFLSDLPKTRRFDTILYIDVLEHIKNDFQELETAYHFIRPNGFLVVVSPAHQWLFTPFDADIGHFRRYDRTSLVEILPEGLRIYKLLYLDSVGMLASLANKLILNQKMPNYKQILTWDRILVPLSKCFDPIIGYRLGKSVVGVFQKIE